MRLLLIAASAVALAACETTTGSTSSTGDATASSKAATTETGETKQAENKPSSGERCEYIAKPGTRFKDKVCMTDRQWEESRRNAQDQMDQIQRSPIASDSN